MRPRNWAHMHRKVSTIPSKEACRKPSFRQNARSSDSRASNVSRLAILWSKACLADLGASSSSKLPWTDCCGGVKSHGAKLCSGRCMVRESVLTAAKMTLTVLTGSDNSSVCACGSVLHFCRPISATPGRSKVQLELLSNGTKFNA